MLQSISSVFAVYRCKTLTGSPDPMHANGTDKPCKEAKTKKKEECVKTALATLKQQNRQANKKTIPKKIKNKPRL